MNKYLKWAALPLILIFTLGATVEPGLKIWQYPNRPVPSDTAFFVLSEGGVTYNVSMFQLRSKITNGVATVNYVNTQVGTTNAFASTNYVIQQITNRVFVAPGSTNVGVVTNYGANGTVTYTIYATNDGSGTSMPSIATNAITGVWSNDVNVATPATNINFWFKSASGVNFTNRNGLVDATFDTLSATVVTQLVTASTQNFQTIIGVRTNQFTTNIDNTPVVGQLWFSGTNGFIDTTGAVRRTFAMEHNPITKSFRWGSLGQMGGNHAYLDNSNFWSAPNLGLYSWGIGTNILVNANFSAVLGGNANQIYTNSSNSVIVAGEGNNIRTNAQYSFIGGGLSQLIGMLCSFSFIGGGQANNIQYTATHATIGGGHENDVHQQYGTVGGGFNNAVGHQSQTGRQYGTVAGGNANNAFGAGSAVGGGSANSIYGASDNAAIAGGGGNIIGDSLNSAATYAFIGGGANNLLRTSSDFSVIGGGELNLNDGGNTHAFIGGGRNNILEANASDYAVIVGGRSNYLSGDYSFIGGGFRNYIQDTSVFGSILGGSSNQIANTDFAMVLSPGRTTNTAPMTVDISGFHNNNKITVDTNGMNFRGITNLVAGTITNLHRYVGRVRLANGQSTYFITNNLAGPNTILTATLNSNCGTTLSNAVPTTGLITLQTVSAVTADADISFQILTP